MSLCDDLDRVNDGKVSVKVIALEARTRSAESPCAPVSLDQWR